MDYIALKKELTGDPLALGYSTMTDEEVAASLNAPGSNIGPFGAHHVVNYFIMQRNREAAKEAAQVLGMHVGMDIDYRDPSHVLLVSLAMDTLIEDQFATEDDKVAVLALGNDRDTRSRAQMLGLRSLGPAHVAKARS